MLRPVTEAISLFATFKPRLILLDLMLPGIDGFEVLKTIRAREDEGKTVPIIVVSNLSQLHDQEKARALGATSYLVKAEVDIDEIVEHIESTLAQPQK